MRLGLRELRQSVAVAGDSPVVVKPSGRLRLSQFGHRYTEGLYHRDALTMHVSRGVGTTFVPFRFFARPEVTVVRVEGTAMKST